MIYLDYHATTPVDSRVGDRILHTLTTDFGNASSIDHEWGDRSPCKNLSRVERRVQRIRSGSRY
ncbi:MAG: hypothetical protein VKJ64_12780 [Leptolyngbyaceae bacterium]|nr:hypothetical protein [Leptolyngbyaceae bacterium]